MSIYNLMMAGCEPCLSARFCRAFRHYSRFVAYRPRIASSRNNTKLALPHIHKHPAHGEQWIYALSERLPMIICCINTILLSMGWCYLLMTPLNQSGLVFNFRVFDCFNCGIICHSLVANDSCLL